MKVRRLSIEHLPLVVLAVCALATGRGAAQEQHLQQARSLQARAAALTTELIETTLSSQLRRLEENGLDHLPLHSEIQALQGQLTRISAADMTRILELLATSADAAPRASDSVVRARQLARQVVVQLIVERQRVRKRLQVAKTTSTVQHLIELQVATRDKTSRLETTAASGRAREATGVLHDQQDVAALLAVLIETLHSISEWDGSLGMTAREAVELCRRDQVEASAARAIERIASGSFAAAVQEQERVLNSLYAALRALERAQGLAALNRAAALRLARRLRESQGRLRDRSDLADLRQIAQRDELSGKQREILRELPSLENMVRQDDAAVKLVETAMQAAKSAEDSLFAGLHAETLDHQLAVLRALESVERRLEEAAGEDPAGAPRPAADELRRLDQALGEALELQSQAAELAPTQPRQAADLERQIADQLPSEASDSYSDAVSDRIEQARDAATAAEETLRNSDDSQSQQQAVAEAEEALWELAAEVKASLPAPQPAASEASPDAGESSPDSPTASSKQQKNSNSTPSKAKESTAKENASGSQDENTQFDSRTADSQQDANVADKRFRDAPWLMRLPPAVQQAIQARSRRQPPAEYAERLERYFSD